MATRTITTTTAEDEAITYSYQQSQKMAGQPGMPAGETEAQYFDRMVHNMLGAMTAQHAQAKNTVLVTDLSTIPEANRPAAQADINAVIVQYGGTVGVQTLTYQWSANTAAPPRVNSIEIDATEANFATLSKITFDDMDASTPPVSRMTSLLTTKVNTLIRVEDAANAANYLQLLTTATPIQRQGADGYVEMAAKFHSKGGSFAGLDTKPLKITFT